MKPIAIFRHLECEGPGYLTEFLQQYKLESTLVRIDQNDSVPDSIDAFSALVFMGGPMSVNDDLPWIFKELNLIQQAARQKMPILGHCLGGQLICKALGGSVTANKVKEIGWHKVQKLNNACSEKWLADIPNEFEAFHWHGETFSTPGGASPILESEFCDNQAFALDNILALQCHIEMTRELVSEWAREYSDELDEPSQSIQSADTIISGLEGKVSKLNRIADKVYRRWITPLLNNGK